jgi:hypothetical protein
MTNTNSSTGVVTRCQFHFSDGRSCRMLSSPAHSSFCAFHARQELQFLESQRLGDEISTSLHGNFLTATDINPSSANSSPPPHKTVSPFAKPWPSLHGPGHALVPPLREKGVSLRVQIRPMERRGDQCRPPLPSSLPHRFQLFSRGPPQAARTRLPRRRMTVDPYQGIRLVH